jgi:ABC-type nickel/cobalt efflux system permease component RcnA
MLLPINKLLLYILLTFFISTASFSCALCSLDIPLVKVITKISALQTKTHFEMQWKFDEKFVSKLSMYDQNENGKFDKEEQELIQQTLEDYLIPNNYLTHIYYAKKYFKSDTQIKITPIETKSLFENGLLYYTFNFDADFILENNHNLDIEFHDTEGNFNFVISDILLKEYKDKYLIKPLLNKVSIQLDDPTAFVNEPIKTPNVEVETEKIKIAPSKTSEKKTIQQPSNNILKELEKQLTIYKQKIQNLLDDIKQNNSPTSYLWLLFFSFLYGILHALGPGHGKSLVGSYFLSQNRSILKAFNISLLIGVVHTFSAFLLTLFIYLVLNMLFISFLTDIEYIATKLSAIIIIAIALYLIYKKYKTKNNLSFTTHNPNTTSCGCSGCNTKSEDIGVILAAGIVPCPGTVTIFIFTFGLGIYYVGFLSAIFMSLGMSLIIFITAYLSINVRKKSSSNTTLKKIFEYGSLLFILFLGLFLLFI